MTHHSQVGQDRILDEEIFCSLRGGVFVDIGAHDGSTYSNTLFFEKYRGWTGVCIEPIPDIFQRLKATRSCVCVCACVGDHDGECDFLRVHSSRVDTEMLSGVLDQYDPRHLYRVEREVAETAGRKEMLKVPVRTLDSILREHHIDRVSYISIDTEGSELAILRTIDPAAVGVRCLTVENNYGDPETERVMAAKGFRLYKTIKGYEQIYVSNQVRL